MLQPRRKSPSPAAPMPSPPTDPDTEYGDDPVSDDAHYLRARAKKETAIAELRSLELREKQGELVDATAVQDAVFKRFREERDALQTWPARISAIIAADLGVDAGRLLVALEKHVREFLAGRSDRFQVGRPS